MPADLKFQQFLNTIVIGVLFELIVIGFFNAIPGLIPQLPFSQYQFLHKDNAPLTIALGVIFSFPSWRFVSSFVNYLMEPVREHPQGKWGALFYKIKLYYIRFFYGLKPLEQENRITAIQNLCAQNASVLSKKYKYKIETFFSIDLSSLSNPDIYRLFEMMNGYVQRSAVYEPFQSKQFNMVYNFHARFAITLNFAMWASLILVIVPYFGVHVTSSQAILLSCVLFFGLLARYFGALLDTSGKGYERVITDFVTSIIAANEDTVTH